jgi:hypothetical protein
MEEMTAAFARLGEAVARAGDALVRFADAWVAGEREIFESHPDVQEVVAQMRGFYGD